MTAPVRHFDVEWTPEPRRNLADSFDSVAHFNGDSPWLRSPAETAVGNEDDDQHSPFPSAEYPMTSEVGNQDDSQSMHQFDMGSFEFDLRTLQLPPFAAPSVTKPAAEPPACESEEANPFAAFLTDEFTLDFEIAGMTDSQTSSYKCK